MKGEKLGTNLSQDEGGALGLVALAWIFFVKEHEIAIHFKLITPFKSKFIRVGEPEIMLLGKRTIDKNLHLTYEIDNTREIP